MLHFPHHNAPMRPSCPRSISNNKRRISPDKPQDKLIVHSVSDKTNQCYYVASSISDPCPVALGRKAYLTFMELVRTALLARSDKAQLGRKVDTLRS
jgi:hypothetical protein